MQAKLPAPRARSVEAVSPVDAGEASGGAPGGQPAVPRLTRPSGRCQGVLGVARPARQEALVRLRQAPVRGPEGRARLSVALHAPRRHLEPPPDRTRPAQRHVQGQGLQDRWPRPVHDDDARRPRVHPPVSHPCAAQGLPSHPPLRLVRQRQPRRDDRASTRTPGPGRACVRRSRRDRAGDRPANRPALPPLWRPHVCHRDLRARLPATTPSNRASRRNQDRHLMSADAASRTRIVKRASRWSKPSHGDARPNSDPSALSTALSVMKIILFAAQAGPRPTSGHYHVAATLLPRVHRDQIAIARRPPTQPPARSFTGGFRTTAAVQAEASRWAVIRNPSQEPTSATNIRRLTTLFPLSRHNSQLLQSEHAGSRRSTARATFLRPVRPRCHRPIGYRPSFRSYRKTSRQGCGCAAVQEPHSLYRRSDRLYAQKSQTASDKVSRPDDVRN